MSLNDLLGVLAVIALLSGFGAVGVRAVLLRRQQGAGGWLSGLLILFTVLYIVFIALDTPGVVAVLTNDVDDIPPASTTRTAVFAGWMWLLHMLLYRLARGRLTR